MNCDKDSCSECRDGVEAMAVPDEGGSKTKPRKP
jgi:hypothetical protein